MGIKFTGEWGRFQAMLSAPRFTERLKREVRRATALNARLVARAIRQQIKKGTPPALAPLTIGIKGSTKSLVDFGELFKGVTTKTLDWDKAFAGILRTVTNQDGESLANLGYYLDQGISIPVTPKMRTMFAVLAAVSAGRAPPSILRGRALYLYERAGPDFEWRPLHPDTKAIVIPPRPFVSPALADPALTAQLTANWQNAVAQALKGRG